jgi:aromatic ring-opening dioxygenase catalytic subunit (LigB family)
MGEIVWAACVSHTGGMLRHRKQVERQPELAAIYDGWEHLRASLVEARPDVLVVLGSDHFHAHSYELMPIFAIGRGDRYRTWGEFGSRQIEIRGHAELSDVLHAGFVAGEFDVAGSVEMRLDHAWACPLQFLDPGNTGAIVPIAVNSFIPPLPSMRRCKEFGELLRSLIEGQELVGRVALVGTGGISHWIGVPETGRINEEFDRRIVRLIESGSFEALAELEDATIVQEGGPGAGELRCWMAVLGATHAASAHPLVYASAATMLTGIGLIEVTLP